MKLLSLLIFSLLFSLVASLSVQAAPFSAAVYNRPEVQQELAYLQKHPSHLARSRARAETWLPHLLPMLRQRQLPLELVWLPVVESAYQTGAESPVGAAGLWQFMPATAQHFGLIIDNEFDGRYATLSASRAAMQYLSQLHQYFDGDWLLALAAYNAGEGRVARAIKKSGTRDFWQLPLPEETRRYVPRFIAVQKLLAIPYTRTPSPLTEHKIQGPIALTQLARHLGVPVAELKHWNGAIKGQMLSQAREYSILVADKGHYQADPHVVIAPQPLFMAPAAGLDISATGALFSAGTAIFDAAPPPGW
ncbi:MAG: lytic transglycosylase domain-containing protein [Candidatus Oceanisphaera merdipullorum]|nr:lytic transglycosylase domain-containing protein [Candidatus Oceanisphaera merdipullorum]